MSASHIVLTLILICGGLPSCAPPLAPERSAPAKNLILISIDTLRADHLGCYGYARETSPRLDARARSGALFLNCTSSSSWTVPAHLSMFTGMDPATHGCADFPQPGRMSDRFDTLASILGGVGFSTAAFTGGGLAGSLHGLDIGFDSYETFGSRFEDNLKAAESWIADAGEAPFFLFFHGFNVHRPYVPPRPYDRKFAGDHRGTYDIHRFRPGHPRPGPDDLEYVISQYDGEIAFTDELLAEFLAALERSGILEQTLVVITSDHGDEFYDHGRSDHGHNLYDELVRVPWIMFGPRVPAVVVHDHVGTIDLLPTVLELLDVGSGTAFQGKSRAAFLRGGRGESEEAVFGATGFSDYPYHVKSVRTTRWKLIVNELAGMAKTPFVEGEYRPSYTHKFTERIEDFVELFDLRADPSERVNLANERPEKVRELLAGLTARLEQSATLARGVDEAGTPDEETLEVLRSLGYID